MQPQPQESWRRQSAAGMNGCCRIVASEQERSAKPGSFERGRPSRRTPSVRGRKPPERRDRHVQRLSLPCIKGGCARRCAPGGPERPQERRRREGAPDLHPMPLGQAGRALVRAPPLSLSRPAPHPFSTKAEATRAARPPCAAPVPPLHQGWVRQALRSSGQLASTPKTCRRTRRRSWPPAGGSRR